MAKVSILLEKLANDLEDHNSEIVLASENDEAILNTVTFALVKAAHIIKEAAKDILIFEPSIDAEDLDELAHVAAEFDGDSELGKYADSIDNVLDILGKKENLDGDLENTAILASVLDNSGDESLAKIASVLDELLLTIAKPKNAIESIKLAEEAEIEKLRTKYKKPSPEFFTLGNEKKEKLADEYNKEIENKIKVYKPMEAPLSSRCSPDMPGVMLQRIGDNTWQDPITKKIYNYDTGYTTLNNEKVPGSSVSNQTQGLADHAPEHVSFSTREQRLNDNNG